ncbi:MAG: DNA adenine methylase [Spirochaetia bacterium]|nr:DNA adenine methylase [Spirochaetia bacterium]
MLTTKINNRRYLGNKYRLLPFIKKTISSECGNFESFADIFAGTGAVSSAYTDKILYSNDILYSNYLLIENIARWEKPEVFGVAKKMDRTALKSKYFTRSAPAAFEDLIKNLNAKYIVVSYNNMANKENDRLNARISDTQILDTLKSKGSVKTFSEQFKAFTTGRSEHLDNEEKFIA